MPERLYFLNLAAAMTTGLRECPALRRTHNVSRPAAHRVSGFAQVKDDDCANRGRCASQSQLRIWGPLTRNARWSAARKRVARQGRITYGAISMTLFVNFCYLWGTSAPRNDCLCTALHDDSKPQNKASDQNGPLRCCTGSTQAELPLLYCATTALHRDNLHEQPVT